MVEKSRKPRRILKEVDKFEARQFREVGMSVKDCAAYFDVSVATLLRGLADMREKFGPDITSTGNFTAERHAPLSSSPSLSAVSLSSARSATGPPVFSRSGMRCAGPTERRNGSATRA